MSVPPNTPGPQTPQSPIVSGFATDPDMAELVALFVQEMPARLASLKASWQSQELSEVQRLAHQIKGASGGYGFSQVGSAAAALEKSLIALSEGSSRSSTDELRSKFDELISLCQRVRT